MWRLWTVVVQGAKPASTTWSIRMALTQVSNLVESQQVDKREWPSLEGMEDLGSGRSGRLVSQGRGTLGPH